MTAWPHCRRGRKAAGGTAPTSPPPTRRATDAPRLSSDSGRAAARRSMSGTCSAALGSGTRSPSAGATTREHALRPATSPGTAGPRCSRSRSGAAASASMPRRAGPRSARSLPFGEAPGQLAIAVGDLAGDARVELAAAAATSAGVNVKVLDAVTGGTIASLFPFGRDVVTAVELAAADVDGDGRQEVIAAASTPDGTRVQVTGLDGGSLGSFYALEPGLAPRASLAAGDLDGDGKAEIVLGTGPTTAPAPPECRPSAGRRGLRPLRPRVGQLRRVPGTLPGRRPRRQRRRDGIPPARARHRARGWDPRRDRDLRRPVASGPRAEQPRCEPFSPSSPRSSAAPGLHSATSPATHGWRSSSAAAPADPRRCALSTVPAAD